MSTHPLNRKFVALTLAFTLLAAMSVVAPSASAVAPAEPIDADGIVIMWDATAVRSASAKIELQRRGLKVRRSLRGGQVTVVDVDPGQIAALAEELSAIPGVLSAEPDYRIHIAWTPNDPHYTSGEQWAYSRIQAPTAWDMERGDAGVVVAVIDTGADLNHPDLAGKLDTVNDRNFTVAASDAGYYSAADDNGHGTHVSGIVAAATNNGVGVAGVAPDVRILPLKAIGADGTGDSSKLAEAIDYATSVGVDVINLSLAFEYGVTSTVVQQAIVDASAAGIIVVAASGNGGTVGVRYPAAYPECIAVGATDRTDLRAPYSTYGTQLDVVAPGGTNVNLEDMVLSTYPTSEYAYIQGTSMATPFVAGAVALLRSFAPSATLAEIRSAIEVSAKDVGAAGFDIQTGHGLLQLRNALDYLTGQDTAPPVTTSNALATYNDVATVTLTADDGAGLGVGATYYSVDGGVLLRASVATVTGYGAHTLSFFSDDVVGNSESTHTVEFFVDDTLPPVTNTNAKAVYDATATVTLVASDGTGSGVASTFYSFNDAAVSSGNVAVIAEMGTHTLTYSSVDVLGNRETSHTVSLTVRGVPDVTRVSGTTRYATAVELSERTYASGGEDTVVMASGETYPDALAASALAGVLDAPLLLTDTHYLPGEVALELTRLGAARVVIVGGLTAVSASVEDALVSRSMTVERLQGRDRYLTAATVAARVAAESAPASVPVAFVVRGDLFPDALAVSSLAAASGAPVLLTSSSTLTSATAQAIVDLGVDEVVVAGGEVSVSEAVVTAIEALPGVSVTRRGGSNRYSTGASVVRYGVLRGWVTADFVGFATGVNFPDALAGGVIAAGRGGVLVLSDPLQLSPETASVITDNGSNHLPIWVFGGTNAVSDGVRNALSALRF